LQNQQGGRLRQCFVFAQQLTFELFVLVFQSTKLAGDRHSLLLAAERRLPGSQVMGKQAALATPGIQGLA
jgi:hypothetical protein